jgi:hypothetical protein
MSPCYQGRVFRDPPNLRRSSELVFEEEEVPVEDLRTRFVGDIEIAEGTPALPTALGASPDLVERSSIKNHLSPKRSNDLYILFNTQRYVFSRPWSCPI